MKVGFKKAKIILLNSYKDHKNNCKAKLRNKVNLTSNFCEYYIT